MVVYTDMGFTNNLQKYIVKIEKSSSESEWVHNRKLATDVQQFEVGVSFQFVKLSDAEAQQTTYLKAETIEIASDIFYPFMSRSAAITSLNALSAVSAALLTTLALL